jgi:hypothetical protein
MFLSSCSGKKYHLFPLTINTHVPEYDDANSINQITRRIEAPDFMRTLLKDIMLWDLEFVDKKMQTVHKEMIFASCVNDCKELANTILKRIKKEDKDLQLLIFEVIVD